MALTALILSRLQFAFTISFHIIFPSFTIGVAAWLVVLDARYLITRKPVYRTLFDFWLKIFAIAFGMGVVSGIVMAFQFGTNWSRLSAATGPIQGPLLSYESFTAFAVEASFFGILIFGRPRVSARIYFLSALMVALGTTLSAYWIMVNNSWMQAPVGYALQNGTFVPTDWRAILFSPVVQVRFPHMLIASYVTGAVCVAATGAWYYLRGKWFEEARAMLHMGLGLAAILLPLQMFFGHLNGDYVHDLQPAKFAAIEARWHDEQPATEVLLALPDDKAETNHFALQVPVLGSIIATMTTTSKEVGLTSFKRADRPPVVIPFFAFRIMVGVRDAHARRVLAGMRDDSAEAPRQVSPAFVADLPVFPAALRGHVDRMVHRRSRTPAVGRLSRPAHRQRRHAKSHDQRSAFDPAPLWRGLRGHLRVWRHLHLPDAPGRPCRMETAAAVGSHAHPRCP